MKFVKKRLIFTLLYDNGFFMLSRNFRLQKVGDFEWLKKHYNFQEIAFSIDELIVLDVTRSNRDIHNFSDVLKKIAESVFVPITAGGGIKSKKDAEILVKSGADKLVLNTALWMDTILIAELVATYGSQCIIASIDFNKIDDDYFAFISNGLVKVELNFNDYLNHVYNLNIGEIYLNSVQQDGTGQNYDFSILNTQVKDFDIPLILAGGAGNSNHLLNGAQKDRVDAVATANLYNFIGNGLPIARDEMIQKGIELAKWNRQEEIGLKGFFEAFNK